MFQVDKNYWLVIAPYVYCCIKGKKALLYNTKNWEYLEVENENVIGLLRQLHKRDNLGAVFCEGKMLTELCYSNFISDFVLKEMGGVIDVASFPDKPIQMMPILNLQCDVDKLQQIEDRGIGENILFNLLEINVFLYNVCDHHCLYCSKYSQQNLCCRVAETETSQVLDISALKSIIAQIRYGVVGRLNLFGGNIWKYPNYNDIPFVTASYQTLHFITIGRYTYLVRYAGSKDGIDNPTYQRFIPQQTQVLTGNTSTPFANRNKTESTIHKLLSFMVSHDRGSVFQ